MEDSLKVDQQNYFPIYLKHKILLTTEKSENLIEFIDSETLSQNFYWTELMKNETYIQLKDYNL